MTDRTFSEAAEPTAPEVLVQPHLVLLLECARPLAGGARFALSGLDEVVVGRGAERRARRDVVGGARRLTIEVPDPWMSGVHGRIRCAEGQYDYEDAGSTNGSRLHSMPVGRGALKDGALLECGRTFFVVRTLPTAARTMADVDASDLAGAGPLATLVPQLAAQLETFRRVAKSAIPILLGGETGTGKEVLARAAHELSGRGGAFVAVNAGALPETLVESLLFGHVRGAFSGAVRDELGFVRSADGGTLFLDEIGDLPRTSQGVLLRVLQEREVIPVGAPRAVHVDVRFIAATNVDIGDLARRGDFRSDLYARLAGYTHALSPLRDRRDDLGLLVAGVLRRVAPERAGALSFAPEAARALLRHDWPHNIRELEQCLKLACVLASDDVVQLEHLTPSVVRARPSSAPPAKAPPSAAVTAEDSGDVESDEALERELREKLAEHHGNVTHVARAMGKARMQIQRWMKRFALDRETFRR